MSEEPDIQTPKYPTGLTDGQAVAEIVQAVAHDDHPGQRSHAHLLKVLLGVTLGVAVGVVVLRVVVVQDVVVVVVMVVVRLAHRVVEVRVALVLTVLVRVGRVRRAGVACRRRRRRRRRLGGRQHELLLLGQGPAPVGLGVCGPRAQRLPWRPHQHRRPTLPPEPTPPQEVEQAV